MSKSSQGRVAVITGAGSGLGAALATRFAAQGAYVALGDINESLLQAIAVSIRSARGTVLTRHCDVSREMDVLDLVNAALDAYGRLDVGVNNAGISTPLKSIVDTEEADLDRAFSINTKGVFFGMKHQIKAMQRLGGGSILNVASMAGLGAAPRMSAYCASKHAVVGLTKTAAVEYAKDNIRINAICPYFTATPMVTSGELSTLQDRLLLGTPMRRLGTPDEVVAVMEMLCSPENTYMTGQAIAVDGGLSAQ